MLILGSNSQTRAKQLQQAKIDFIQKSADFDEGSIKADNPRSFVYLAAMGKMEASKSKFGLDKTILCADSLVGIGNKKLGKAYTQAEAREKLNLQSGNRAYITSCTILYKPEITVIDLSTTYYTFKAFERQDLENYIESKEWQGKAGACMVEGFCKKYIEKVEGLESTALGMTLEKVLPFV